MRESLSLLRDVGHRFAGASRRARRHQAGAAPHSLRDARDEPDARQAASQVRGRHRRSAQELTTRTATRRSTTRSCAWRKISRCAIRSSTATGISARSTAIRRPPIVIRKRGSRASRWRCWPISIKIPSISSPISIIKARSRSCCRRVCRSCWSTVPAVSPSAWRRIFRRTTSARSATRIALLIDEHERRAIDDALARHRARPRFSDRPARSWATRRSAPPISTGRGSVTMRGKAEIVEEKGRHKIVITEVPFQVTKSRIVEAIAELTTEKTIAGISGLDDESNRKGMRIVVELQRNATPNVVLNQLYKHTPLQTSFGFNMLALVPVRRTVERSNGRADADARAAGALAARDARALSSRIASTSSCGAARLRSAQGAKSARTSSKASASPSINIDEVIAIIRESDVDGSARAKRCVDRFKLSVIQANAILDMRLRTLTGLERQKIEDEYSELASTRSPICATSWRSPRAFAAIVKSGLRRYQEALRRPAPHADRAARRRTHDAKTSSPIRDVVVTSTVGGYIKRVSVDTFRAQNRGGRGVTGIANLKREDVVQQLLHGHDASTRPVLHEQGPRVSSARVRDPRLHASSARHGARQSPDAAAGRKRHGGLPDPRTSKKTSISSW